ncbi:hypothetical protein [Ferruginibacter sp.]
MKKCKLHQWLTLLLASALIISCNKKNYPVDNTRFEDDKQAANQVASLKNYTPPLCIVVPDKEAQVNKEGEMYYDDQSGYRYWRSQDGKYYLDNKYKTGTKPNNRLARKHAKKQHKNEAPEELATQ